MKENLIKTKSFSFALRTVKLYQFLSERRREYVVSRQVLRSGTAIGALIRESEHAESAADFVHKLSIALKEANETDYWIDILYYSDYFGKSAYTSIKQDVTELLKMLTAIIKTTKLNRKS